MKTHHFVSRFALPALLTALALALPASSAFGQAIVSNLNFGQLDWYDENDALRVSNSSWGRMSMTLSPDAANVYYLNVVGNANGQTPWLVQNMPILPASFGDPSRQSVEFNIADFGLAAGQDLSSMNFTFSIDATPRNLAPSGAFSLVNVANVQERATGGKLEPFPADVGVPAGIKAMGAVSKVIQHKNVPSVQEGKARCLPGSQARSLGWLNSQYQRGVNKTAQQIYNDLIALKIGSMGVGATTYEQDIVAKSNYLKNFGGGGTTKVRDLNNRLGAIGDVPKDTKTDLVDWLYQELTTEDVELDYGHHIVTVTGIYMQDGMTYLKFRDDEVQGDDTMGDTDEKRGKLTLMDGMYYFRRDPVGGVPGNAFKVQVAIAESVPEPGLVALLGANALILIGYRRKRRSRTSA